MTRRERYTDELAEVMARAWQMPASRFILEVQHLGADPVAVCNELHVESRRL
ncbi:hypothetical protein [Nocardia sp. NPDC058633]|uniref:hypothetical protein n=1 Tax=Nocardia sp. NPDC058633 TaxID=3346568 RepID=UPI003668004B